MSLRHCGLVAIVAHNQNSTENPLKSIMLSRECIFVLRELRLPVERYNPGLRKLEWDPAVACPATERHTVLFLIFPVAPDFKHRTGKNPVLSRDRDLPGNDNRALDLRHSL